MTTTADICSDGDNRTTKELIVKLIVAHVAAIAAFCNLQSLRNERLDSIEPILFLLSPLIVVVQTALGLIVIHAALIYNIVFSPRPFQEKLGNYSHQWKMLFGRNPPSKSVELDGALSGPLRRRAIRSELGRAWLKLGRSAAIFGTLFQFFATIFLYRRRLNLHGWDSLTVVDHRTFELSVGGAAASILSLALLLRFPGFNETPRTDYVPNLDIEATLIFCRGDPRRCPRWYQILYLSDFGSTTSALAWLFCVGSSTYKGESKWLNMMQDTYIALFGIFEGWLPADTAVTTFYLLVGVFLVVAYIAVQTFAKSVRMENASMWVLIPGLIFICSIALAVFYLYMMCLMPLVFFSFPAMLSGPTCIFLTKGYEIRALFSQPPFITPGSESDCLLLWKDPLAEYLWSLV
ncbi:hypothetical protein FHETE_6182 [Fusarium heterosporum]|uniref:Uncharacterized protein n=1 Tax=Fusarium heterosporum TaxID=42747 RepID=A0A8H5TBD0_FUSHE|nr:hypothetical protein FHETE_6182 [Fusarium heterosporum]